MAFPRLASAPKGDIANLLLIFPRLAASDFAPWMDPAEPALPVESYAAWSKTLSAHHYETARAELLYGAALKLISAPGESEGDFRVRLRHRPRELCDTQLTTLNNSYAQARGLAGAPGCRAGQ